MRIDLDALGIGSSGRSRRRGSRAAEVVSDVPDSLCFARVSGGWVDPQGELHAFLGMAHSQWAAVELRKRGWEVNWDGQQVRPAGTSNACWEFSDHVLIDEGWIRIANPWNIAVSSLTGPSKEAWRTAAQVVADCAVRARRAPDDATVLIEEAGNYGKAKEFKVADFIVRHLGRAALEVVYEKLFAPR